MASIESDTRMAFTGLDLAGASLPQLRALHAALALDLLGAVDPELVDLLRGVADGTEPDAVAFEQCWDRISRNADEQSWYDGGFVEAYQLTRQMVEVVLAGDLESTRDACTRIAERLFGALSRGHFWNALHASGYRIDHDRAHTEAAAHARAILEERRSRAFARNQAEPSTLRES